MYHFKEFAIQMVSEVAILALNKSIQTALMEMKKPIRYSESPRVSFMVFLSIRYVVGTK